MTFTPTTIPPGPPPRPDLTGTARTAGSCSPEGGRGQAAGASRGHTGSMARTPRLPAPVSEQFLHPGPPFLSLVTVALDPACPRASRLHCAHPPRDLESGILTRGSGSVRRSHVSGASGPRPAAQPPRPLQPPQRLPPARTAAWDQAASWEEAIHRLEPTRSRRYSHGTGNCHSVDCVSSAGGRRRSVERAPAHRRAHGRAPT